MRVVSQLAHGRRIYVKHAGKDGSGWFARMHELTPNTAHAGPFQFVYRSRQSQGAFSYWPNVSIKLYTMPSRDFFPSSFSIVGCHTHTPSLFHRIRLMLVQSILAYFGWDLRCISEPSSQPSVRWVPELDPAMETIADRGPLRFQPRLRCVDRPLRWQSGSRAFR